MPAFYQLCWRAMARHNPHAVLLGPSEVAAMGGSEILAAADGLPIPIRSDLVRAWLLATYGGIWVDLDTICLQPMDWTDLPDLRVVRQPAGIVATPWAARRGSPAALWILQECLRLVAVQKSGGRVPYGATSRGLLRAAVNRFGADVRQHWRYSPIPWDRARSTFLRRARRWQSHESSAAYRPGAVCYHLTAVPPSALSSETEDGVLTSRTFAAFLLGRSLELEAFQAPDTFSILERIPLGRPTVGVEVGVFRARNAARLLAARPLLTLYLVDPWANLNDRTYRATGDFQAFRPDSWWSAVERSARRAVAFAGARAIVVRTTSSEAGRRFDVGQIDFCYVDANHSRPAVAGDLETWTEKISPGGWIGGHDYDHLREGRGYGVRCAVDAAAGMRGLVVCTGRYFTWFLQL
jgi:hypothetical protein